MTNEQLVIRIKAGENADDNMETLYSQVRSFIHAMAWKYRGSGEVDDLEQEGYLALYPAIAGYDPDQKVKFLTYAEYWIRLYMKRYLQTNGSCLRLPVNCQEKVRQYEKFCTDFAVREGRMGDSRLFGFKHRPGGRYKEKCMFDKTGEFRQPDPWSGRGRYYHSRSCGRPCRFRKRRFGPAGT